jgi:diaminohydroxyphosphoribosylaminopyrimidine deaminase/5-amino-6-(5-phosphoribosylamino)uracil reductase
MFDQVYIRRCLDLAAIPSGYNAPNPMVGAVLVSGGRIIGEGYHKKYGEPHAEANAINSVKETELLSRSTLYVNLEPCVHHGKTPPCTDLIIKHKIPTVVIGSTDPNPLVSGKGIERLRSAGVNVVEHILKDECDSLNIRFMTYHKKRRPYILLKWAQTADKFIDTLRNENNIGRPNWITSWYERRLVHKWRSQEQAIFVGTNTVAIDNPFLDVRHWHGKKPLRVVIDKNLRLASALNVFDGSQPTLFFTEKNKEKCTEDLEYQKITFDKHLPERILENLYARKITSILIEGGSQLLQSFIDAGLWDEARIFEAKTTVFNEGIKAPTIFEPKNNSDMSLQICYLSNGIEYQRITNIT